MAKYLKPLRGKFSSATQQDILLRKGEMFLCLLNNDNMGQGPGAIYLGDGISAFNGYNHNGSTVPNTAQPFLVHPAKYNPIFANTNPSTASWTIDDGSTEINNIGKGKAEVDLPTIIGNIKGALCKHANSITRLANDADAIRGTLDEHARELANHSDSIASHSDSIASLDQRVSNLEGKIGELYPVGSVYITVINKNPNEILGYGTWSKLPANYVLKTISSGDGGSTAAATNTEGTALTKEQLPAHSHNMSSYTLTAKSNGSTHTHNMSSYTLTAKSNGSTHTHVVAEDEEYSLYGNTIAYSGEIDGAHTHDYGWVKPGWQPGQEQAGSGTDTGHWEYSKCPGNGAHSHLVEVGLPRLDAKSTGSAHTHSIDVPEKTTSKDGAHTHSIDVAARNTKETGSGEKHAHKTGMPASIGVYVWRRDR